MLVRFLGSKGILKLYVDIERGLLAKIPNNPEVNKAKLVPMPCNLRVFLLPLSFVSLVCICRMICATSLVWPHMNSINYATVRWNTLTNSRNVTTKPRGMIHSYVASVLMEFFRASFFHLHFVHSPTHSWLSLQTNLSFLL